MFIAVFEETIPASRNVIAGAYYTKLRPILQEQEGFISESGYQCPHDEKKHLALAKFTDAEAAHRWRTQPNHLRVQRKSRTGVFEDYRLRCGSVIEPDEYYTAEDTVDFTSTPSSTSTSASASTSTSSTNLTSKRGRYMVIYEELIADREKPGQRSHIETALLVAASGIFDEAFDITPYANDTNVVWLISFATKKAAVKCRASQAYENVRKGSEDWTHLIRVERDYGKNDRKEAPMDSDSLQDEVGESPPAGK